MIENQYSWGFNPNQLHFWHWYNYLTEKLVSKMDIKNTPDTINKNYLIRRLLLDGKIAFFNDMKDGLTAYQYNNIEQPDKYGQSRKIQVVYKYGNQQGKFEFTENEYVPVFSKKSVALNRGIGFVSEVCRSATILANIDTTFNIQLENDRVIAIVTALTETDIVAVNELFEKMRAGERKICVKKNLIDDISVNPLSQVNNKRDYDEYQKMIQYYKAEFFNDIGINAMTTTKKERLVSDEVTANEESVFFSFSRVVDEVNAGLKKVNEKFQTDMKAIEIEYEKRGVNDANSENEIE